MANEFYHLEYPKSDLYFINCLREVLGLDPLHNGQEGEQHYLSVAKRNKAKLKAMNENNIQISEEETVDEIKEIEELAKVVNIKVNGKLIKYSRPDCGPKPNYLGRESLAYFPESM